MNHRCAGTWALLAVLSHLSPWVRTWTNLSSHSGIFFLCSYEVVLVVGVFSHLGEEQSSKSPEVYQRCRQRKSRRGSPGDSAAQKTLQDKSC